MYEKVFQLNSRPFVSTPNVERFFSASAVHHALTQACSCIERASGSVLVVGPTGSGKTLFLNMLQEQFQKVYQVVNLACARLAERQDLLQNILFELNQPYTDMSEGELRLKLIEYLKPNEACPNGILLLVDEAHLLTPHLLDEIRLLSNLVRDGRPRAQLVLAGSSRLEENLVDSNLESFNQRVAARCYLSNFTRAETAEYISSAVLRAGAVRNEIFTTDAMEAVFEVTEGCPRLINQVCDHAMILSASDNILSIDAACIFEAWSDVQHLPNPWAVSETTVTSNEGSPDVSAIEFGNLDDEDDELGLAPPCQQEVEPEFQIPNSSHGQIEFEMEGDWKEVEFGVLQPSEADELKKLTDIDSDDQCEETLYQLGKAKEPEFHVVDPPESVERPEVVESSEEYQLAPVESIDTMIPLSDYSTIEDADSGLTVDDESEFQPDLDAANYVDVRFKDLAQFLANGGVVDSEESKRYFGVQNENDTVPEEVVDVQIESLEAEVDELYDIFESDETPLEPQEQIELQYELANSLEKGMDDPSLLVQQELVEDLEPEFSSSMNSEDKGRDEVEGQVEPSESGQIKVFQSDEDVPVEDHDEMIKKSIWKNPFSEPFDQEEIVYDPYSAIVAEQNNRSLSITRNQLSILDQPTESSLADSIQDLLEPISNEQTQEDMGSPEGSDSHEQVIGPDDREVDEELVAQLDAVEQIDVVEPVIEELAESSPVDRFSVEPESVLPVAAEHDNVEETLDNQDAVENAEELPIDESELLETIQRQQAEIAEQIIQLKQDLAETSEVHEETSPHQEDRDEDHSHHLAIEYPLLRKPEDSGSQEAEPASEDDRDILVITRVNQPQTEVARELAELEPDTPVSTGRAVRMDYNQLFRQLRAAE